MPRLRLLTLLLLLLAAPAWSAKQPPVNLLNNPGFEDVKDGVTADWDTTDSGLPTVFFGRDSVDKHGGAVSVYVASISRAIAMWHNWSQTLLVGEEMQGKDLVLSVWTRSNGLDGRGYILLQCYRDPVTVMSRRMQIPRAEAMMRMGIAATFDPVRSLAWERQYFSEPNTGWVRREVRLHVPPGTDCVFARCGIFGTGQVSFDDAALTAEPARSDPPLPLRTNLLKDPGFEGDGNSWEYSIPPFPTVQVERDTTVAHKGRASMRLHSERVGLGEARTGVVQHLDRLDLGSKRFRISGWTKTDSLKGIAFMIIYFHRPDTVKVGPSFGRISMTNDWTHSEGEFDTPPGTVEMWVNAIYTLPASGTVWYDDLSLEYLGPTPPSKAPKQKAAPPPPPKQKTQAKSSSP